MSDDWMNDSRFEHFWVNYNRSQPHFIKHHLAYWKSRALATEYENEYLHWLLQNVCLGETRSDAVSRKATTEQPFPSDEQNNPENIEMEITDEMLEFFAQSMQHKKEQREKENDSHEDQVVFVNIDEMPLESRAVDIHHGMDADYDARTEKTKAYEKLYGPSHAPRIQAMETAMQLQFSRNCDRFQPKLWPNMPLRM